MEGADKYKFESNEKGILGKKKNRNKKSLVGIEFKMSWAWINEFLLHWFDATIEYILRKT